MDRSFAAKCFIPWCPHTTRNMRDKVFVKVPTSLEQEWGRLVGLHGVCGRMYCCEDHLNLQEDLQNYYEWKLMQRTPRLKNTAKLKLSVPEDCLNEDMGLTVKDQTCKSCKQQYHPTNNVKVTPRIGKQRPMAKWRRVCVIPHNENISSGQPISDLSVPTGSLIITEMKRFLVQPEVPMVTIKQEPMTGNTEWQPEIKAIRSLKNKSHDDCSTENYIQDETLHLSGEDISDSIEESASMNRRKSTYQNKYSSSNLMLSEEDGENSSPNDDSTGYSASLSESTQVIVKEETQDTAPEIELQMYKSLDIHHKDEITRLGLENRQLIKENQRLKVKVENVVDYIKKLLNKQKNNDQTTVDEDNNIIQNGMTDLKDTDQNANKIDTLIEENRAQLKEIQELKEKNQKLSSKIQEIMENNKTLSDKNQELSDCSPHHAATIQSVDKDEKEEEGDSNIMRQTLRGDVGRNSDKKEMRRIQDLKRKATLMDKINNKPMKTRKRKRKT